MPQVTDRADPLDDGVGVGVSHPTGPLAETIQAWVETRLAQRGYARPTIKRVALLVTGLVVAPRATRGDLALGLAGLQLSGARPASIARRLARLLDDPALDPQRLLPDLFGPDELTLLLAGEIAAHAANAHAPTFHHQRFRPLHLVVDLTSKRDQVVILAVGLAYRGVVLPLAVRTWPHNRTLDSGTYWRHLLSALSEVHERLPEELRAHLVLVADRAFGVPRMVDAANALGWAWVLRVQGQVRVRLSAESVVPVRTLAAHPGAVWFSGFGQAVWEDDGDPSPTVLVFKDAGWRPCQLIAVWEAAAAEPWLLITNLPASREQVQAYAQRWAVERLFLSWKSHGWDLEALQLRAPARVGRLVAGLALATLWCLRIAAAHTQDVLAKLAAPLRRRMGVAYQPPLPGLGPAHPDPRPYPAHFSLLSWGRKVIALTPARGRSPALCWTLPHWSAPIWSIHCTQVLNNAA